ncbi:MAG TPA: HlyD family secretion protein [Xanthobacteraceae bacterium]|jgi:membrane fusion protein (multidrug efflux system)|nr:HlyD family secretion protein [Xanthobacteraceae bacterium]
MYRQPGTDGIHGQAPGSPTLGQTAARDPDHAPEVPGGGAPLARDREDEHLPAAVSPRDDESRPLEGAVEPPARGGRRKLALLVVLALAIAAGGAFGYRWWTVGRFVVSTDDAYVHADNTTLAAKVSGYVETVAVEDNARVRAGDVIARIDDGDYRLAVDSARAKVATQQATIERFGRQITAQQANVEQAKAQLVSAQAAAKRAQSELDRQQALAVKDFASRQTLEQSLANRDQTAAAVSSAEAAIEGAQASVDVLRAQQQEAERTLGELKTALAKAERDLSFTVIRAPVDGVIGNRAVQPGDYVQPGQRLASLVPLDDVYIDANFKETQLAGLRPGQKAEVSVDAVPDRTIEGTIESVAPASGAVFSLLPPDNATGNFTKIVQRLAVRIRVPQQVADERVLRPGMSVVVSVNTKSQPAAAASAGRVARRAMVAGR